LLVSTSAFLDRSREKDVMALSMCEVTFPTSQYLSFYATKQTQIYPKNIKSQVNTSKHAANFHLVFTLNA
jgi:hypothetical protein